MSDRDLKETILDLLRLGYEGTYWDYKEDYTDCKEDKLIDIICMANNIDGHEAYLIYGADDSGNIKGIRGISVIHTFCNLAEGFLLLRDRHPLEDTVVAAADSFCLVIGKVSVLWHFHIIRVQVSTDMLHNGVYLIQRDVYRTLRDDVADAVANEDYNGLIN